MIAAPPVWISPRACLIEAGCRLNWSDLAPRVEALAAEFRALRPSRVAVEGGSVATVVATLAAAERADVEVLLLRSPGGAAGMPADARVAVNGTVHPLGQPVPDAAGFAVLLPTSGTTGTPKLARHAFARLLGAGGSCVLGADVRWLLTFEPTAFAGLQVILTALAAGARLVAAPGEGAAGLARLAVTHGVTHISATPSFWRALLMALPGPLPLRVATLGGEAVDQPLLDRLAAGFPGVKPRHIYASSEAGALFTVADGRAGFPAAWLETGRSDLDLRLRDGVLEVRSPRAMLGYVGDRAPPFTPDGWLVTGDRAEIAGDRVLFTGRQDGRVNIGGVKVSPETVETALLGVPGVREAVVTAAANPITGHVLMARIVLDPGADPDSVRAAIRALALAPAERPRRIAITDAIALVPSGKKARLPHEC